MKQLLFFPAFFFFAAVTFAQQSNQTAVVGGKQADHLEWINGTTHDFGQVKLNDIVSCTFEFINNGKQPVTILKAAPSCSCTVPEFSKDPVLPGQKGTVKATFNAHKPGPIEKNIVVMTDLKDTVVLKLAGEVVQ